MYTSVLIIHDASIKWWKCSMQFLIWVKAFGAKVFSVTRKSDGKIDPIQSNLTRVYFLYLSYHHLPKFDWFSLIGHKLHRIFYPFCILLFLLCVTGSSSLSQLTSQPDWSPVHKTRSDSRQPFTLPAREASEYTTPIPVTKKHAIVQKLAPKTHKNFSYILFSEHLRSAMITQTNAYVY